MQKLIIDIGRCGTIALITLISIIVSTLVTIFIMEALGRGIEPIHILISIITPALIAPSVFWYIIGLFVKIDQLERT